MPIPCGWAGTQPHSASPAAMLLAGELRMQVEAAKESISRDLPGYNPGQEHTQHILPLPAGGSSALLVPEGTGSIAQVPRHRRKAVQTNEGVVQLLEQVCLEVVGMGLQGKRAASAEQC